MDFVLGILVGAFACILYGQYLTERQRKHQREQQKQMMETYKNLFKSTWLQDDLQRQLDEAIAREDFKEAARIQKLIDKKP